MPPRSCKTSSTKPALAAQHQLYCADPPRCSSTAPDARSEHDAVDGGFSAMPTPIGSDGANDKLTASTLSVDIDAVSKGRTASTLSVGTDEVNKGRTASTLSVGIDEAGRGCLAGPVVAAAVILPAHFSLPFLNDSKVLSAKQRAVLAPQIKAVALHWSVGLSWPREIERYNILQATFHAMARAVHGLRAKPSLLLVDGNKRIPPLVLARFCRDLNPSQQAIVGGDALVPAISAASILAKTYRDHLMEFFHRRYPVYAFDAHKGYGTKVHMQALVEHGPCPLHRMTFAGVLPPQSLSCAPPTQGQLW